MARTPTAADVKPARTQPVASTRRRTLRWHLQKRAYLLLTEAALGWLGVDPIRSGLATRVESYEHLGDIRCFVRDLPEPPRAPSAAAVALRETAAA